MQGNGVFTKNRLPNTLSLGTKSCKKNERGHFEQRSAHQAKKLYNFADWLERQQGALHTFF